VTLHAVISSSATWSHIVAFFHCNTCTITSKFPAVVNSYGMLMRVTANYWIQIQIISKIKVPVPRLTPFPEMARDFIRNFLKIILLTEKPR